MFLSKLRLLSAVYHRSNVVQETLRKSRINFPAISVRTYARFIDDDEDDMPIRQTRVERQDPKSSHFRERRSFDRRESSGQRQSYGQRESYGQRQSYGNRNSFNNNRSQFQPSRSTFAFNDGIQKLQPINFDADELGELKKDFYQPSEITKNRSDAEVEEFRKKHEISVPRDAPKPIFTFNELENLPPNVAKEIQKQNFIECTAIQAQGMPIALSGKNMVGIAQTG